MAIELPALPFERNALEPHISARDHRVKDPVRLLNDLRTDAIAWNHCELDGAGH